MPEVVQSGLTYRIINAKSGTAIDLSAADNRSIIGYPYHNTPNQHWTLTWVGDGWTFHSVASGLYINIARAPADGTVLVASSTPYKFHIWHDEVHPLNYRIFVPQTSFNFGMYGNGDPTPGTLVTLWAKWRGIHQTWRFERV
ncbi:ricin B-like lectin [Mycena rebaudengoi]|nr:ricin B-like lectin [Mycena rebaudengoi]